MTVAAVDDDGSTEVYNCPGVEVLLGRIWSASGCATGVIGFLAVRCSAVSDRILTLRPPSRFPVSNITVWFVLVLVRSPFSRRALSSLFAASACSTASRRLCYWNASSGLSLIDSLLVLSLRPRLSHSSFSLVFVYHLMTLVLVP